MQDKFVQGNQAFKGVDVKDNFYLDGTKVTATATELNLIDGVTATTSELNILDGVTADKDELNIMDGVTATTSEINYVDVTSAGTGEASKALVVDANGEIDITSLKLVGEIIPVSVSMSVTADVVDRVVFIANENYEVIAVREVHSTAETTATTLYAQVERLQGTEALGNGDSLLTDNTNSGFDLKGTADTVQTGSLVSDGTQQLDQGDRLGMTISASGNEIAGVLIQLELKRLS